MSKTLITETFRVLARRSLRDHAGSGQTALGAGDLLVADPFPPASAPDAFEDPSEDLLAEPPDAASLVSLADDAAPSGPAPALAVVWASARESFR